MPADLTTSDTTKLQQRLHDAVDAGLPGVVAAVSVDGETVFEGTAGVRELGASTPMTIDSVLAIFSMTKAITGTAAMQLVERGEVALDEPASRYLPLLAETQVLDGFTADATPILRAPRTPITLRHLLTHTSGFVYEMWNADVLQYLAATGTPGFGTRTKAALRVPLMFDPGTRWEYGTGIDYAGLLVEAVTGTTLGRFCAESIFEPLAMVDTGFTPTESMAQRRARLHVTTDDGLVPFDLPQPPDAEFEMGGGGLLSTVPDYLRFLNAILRGGELDGTRILEASTVSAMSRDSIAPVMVQPLTSVNPMLTLDVDFFPGQPSAWGLTFLINNETTPQGRPAGSLAWAGLANSYYWIDRVNNVCGMWATQVLPFFEPAAIEGFRSFETAFYDSLR